ncbi:hypothetical protein ABZU45_35535 [Streptomyces avermitilis]|uniref:hypothetical protein n=1 Tax=Streptomyces avermitilis TaxID=33903 RepID=UPI0033A93A17
METRSKIVSATPHRLRPDETGTHRIELKNHAASEIEVQVVSACRKDGPLAYIKEGKTWSRKVKLEVRKRISLPKENVTEEIINNGGARDAIFLEEVSLTVTRPLKGPIPRQMLGRIVLGVDVR